MRPCSFSRPGLAPLSSAPAQAGTFLAMNWSPRFCASPVGVRFSRLPRSRPTRHVAAVAGDLRQAVDHCCRGRCATPAYVRPGADNSDAGCRHLPCSSSASSRCCGSIIWLSCPIARLCVGERLLEFGGEFVETCFRFDCGADGGAKVAISTALCSRKTSTYRGQILSEFRTTDPAENNLQIINMKG